MVIKPKKTALRWQICRHCDCNIPGNMFDLRVHLAKDHPELNAWTMLDEDIQDEYRFEINIIDHNLKPISN